MNDAFDGSNFLLSAPKTDHTVVPSPSNIAPHSVTGTPRCSWYQRDSAALSLVLKKMPPMPVTRAMADTMHNVTWPITWDDVLAARARLAPHLPATPLRHYPALDAEVGGVRVLVKHDNHLPTNAFKARNAL